MIEQNTIESQDMAETVTLHTGEVCDLRLPGKGSAGYTWSWSIEGEKDRVQVSLKKKSGPLERGDIPQSNSFTEVFTIRGVQPGSVLVRFALGRLWEKEKPPYKEQLVRVIVLATHEALPVNP